MVLTKQRNGYFHLPSKHILLHLRPLPKTTMIIMTTSAPSTSKLSRVLLAAVCLLFLGSSTYATKIGKNYVTPMLFVILYLKFLTHCALFGFFYLFQMLMDWRILLLHNINIPT